MRKWMLIGAIILGLLIHSACKTTTPETALSPLPAEAQEIAFEAGDGHPLEGRYYPAATNPAPVVVLMHWYSGDQSEWIEIAHWLQNRGLGGDGDGAPWRDSAWFPEITSAASVAVFTFTFRGCAGGCKSPDPAGWLLDARAAMEQAAALPGVDANRIVSIGASIGADGAVVGCSWLVAQPEGDCLGALSLSPGGYLIENYGEIVQTLGEATPPRQAWCFYDESEESARVCTSPTGEHFHAQGWSGGHLHGLHLLNPDAEPNPLELMLEFLEETGF